MRMRSGAFSPWQQLFATKRRSTHPTNVLTSPLLHGALHPPRKVSPSCLHTPSTWEWTRLAASIRAPGLPAWPNCGRKVTMYRNGQTSLVVHHTLLKSLKRRKRRNDRRQATGSCTDPSDRRSGKSRLKLTSSDFEALLVHMAPLQQRSLVIRNLNHHWKHTRQLSLHRFLPCMTMCAC